MQRPPPGQAAAAVTPEAPDAPAADAQVDHPSRGGRRLQLLGVVRAEELPGRQAAAAGPKAPEAPAAAATPEAHGAAAAEGPAAEVPAASPPAAAERARAVTVPVPLGGAGPEARRKRAPEPQEGAYITNNDDDDDDYYYYHYYYYCYYH